MTKGHSLCDKDRLSILGGVTKRRIERPSEWKGDACHGGQWRVEYQAGGACPANPMFYEVKSGGR